ncbi:uncharacterized protein AMSG_09465 [Thecamonas trahens ATCC 50062]|uniref:Uncharacterized protein n=1 Tax=Thecamonas trahens ATCC 50062 TaxID=461836 RepID=A0A0L0DNB8_THETB|nr:hypothetical protein AMSG_09465 [Thecamonas trahens ATCC 50062]KNC53750.1 hypothetical protein AMSG_09465 [Thecamonas trahens ATCC 50062]|eukprot:XP_013754313.1 hypothetical protein AMSG_09465 [Thecamonas trahens ATCC 50062]
MRGSLKLSSQRSDRSSGNREPLSSGTGETAAVVVGEGQVVVGNTWRDGWRELAGMEGLDVNLGIAICGVLSLLVWCLSAGTWVSREPMPWFLGVNTAIVLALFTLYGASTYIMQHVLGVYRGRLDMIMIEPDS